MTAQVAFSPAEKAPIVPEMAAFTGMALAVLDALPSSPLPFEPQHASAPFTSAHACVEPTVTRVAPRGMRVTVSGVFEEPTKGGPSPSPSCPFPFAPQQRTCPVVVTAHVFEPAAAICVAMPTSALPGQQPSRHGTFGAAQLLSPL